MTMICVPNSQALSPGSDLWILPDPSHSDWSRLVDWYCNFQIWRLCHKEPAVFSPEILETLSEMDWHPPIPHLEPDSPILLIPGHQLAVRCAVILFDSHDPIKWVQAARKMVDQLGIENVRLFLPPSVPEELLLEEWGEPKINTQNQKGISYVKEQILSARPIMQ